MMHRIGAVCLIASLGCAQHALPKAPDIRSVEPDLAIPPLEDGTPRANKRVKQVLAGYEASGLYHVVYLPTNYDKANKHPVIIEFAGNGGYRNQFGDTCEGVPEGCKLGYGISAGTDFIWICLPFVTADGEQVAKQWWGSPPEYSPQKTISYAKQAVAALPQRFGVDEDAILLCGFSRGAIACNFIGLHDDEIAELWCGFVVYSHYDGVRDWGLPGSDRQAALDRLRRLGKRPQFVCHEDAGDGRPGLAETETMIRESRIPGDFTFAETGFRNHNDAWILRSCSTRAKLRQWVRSVPAVHSALGHLERINELGN